MLQKEISSTTLRYIAYRLILDAISFVLYTVRLKITESIGISSGPPAIDAL